MNRLGLERWRVACSRIGRISAAKIYSVPCRRLCGHALRCLHGRPLPLVTLASCHFSNTTHSSKTRNGTQLMSEKGDALLVILKRSVAKDDVVLVEAILSRLLQRYQILCGECLALDKLSALISDRQRKLFALSKHSSLLTDAPFQDWISFESLKGEDLQLVKLRDSLNEAHSAFINARDREYQRFNIVRDAAGEMYNYRLVNDMQRDHSIVSQLLSNDLLPTEEDVQEQIEALDALSRELDEFEPALDEAEQRFSATNDKFIDAIEALRTAEANLQGWKDKYASAGGRSTAGITPLHIWAAFHKFYSYRNAWRQCSALLAVAEHQHPLGSDSSAALRDHFSTMYNDTFGALCRSGQFEQALELLPSMKKTHLTVKVSVMVDLLTAFGTACPAVSLVEQKVKYEQRGRFLVGLCESVVQCVVEVGDRLAHMSLDQAEKLSAEQYQEIIETRGYLTVVKLVEGFMDQLVRYGRVDDAEQMVTLLHEQYPQFLTSKALLPLLIWYKHQGKYDKVVKTYSLWSRSVFKQYQENAAYNVVIHTLQLEDGRNVNRCAKFIDANNPQLDVELN